MLRRSFAGVFVATALFAQTGTAVPELAELDSITQGLMSKWQVPGASLAVAVEGRLVYARSFGVTDRGQTTPVTPDSLFRMASLTKPLTALGILKLVDEGKLRLDDRVFGQILTDFTPPAGRTADPRYSQVTVRQLLQHVSGMQGGDQDPLFPPLANQAATAFSVPGPATADQIVRFSLTQAPAGNPGSQYLYSNVGFTTLGRVIERVSGKPYAQFLRDDVFAAAGVTRIRPSRTRLAERAAGEVRYHAPAGTPLVNSVYAGDGMVELPYGRHSLEAMEGAGALMGTAVDLVRIWSRLDPSRPGSLVSASGFQELIRRPSPPVSVGTAAYYGLGFNVRPVGGSATLWHFGGLPGTRSYAARFASGVTFAVLFNFRPNVDQGQDQAFEDEFEAAYNNFLTRSRTWPAHDYFPLYYTGERARVVDNGIVSAASFKAGAVSPGQILTLFGLNLGPKELITARLEGGNRLANNLAGTRVLFDGTPAPLVYVSETQLSAIVPYNVAGKSRVRVEVERLGVPSAAQELSIAEAAPALFTANASGVGPAAATVYPTERIAVLYATGEGLVNPLPPDGALATTQPLPAPRLPVRVLLGKGSEAREAEVLYAGAAPGLTAGLLQINIKYPEGTPSGIAVTLQVGTAQSPDGVTLEIP